MDLNARVAVAVALSTYDPDREVDIYLVMFKKNIWEFPGGKLKPGETLRDAARREFLEETGADVNIGNIVKVFSNSTDDGQTFVLIIFAAMCMKTFEPVLKEHTQYKWATHHELATMPSTAARLRAAVEEIHSQSIFDRDVTDRDWYPWYQREFKEDPKIGKTPPGRLGPDYPQCDQVGG